MLKGQCHTQETIAKMRKSHKGKYHSDEAKRKIREARIGKPLSSECRDKISLAHKGKILSEEHRNKLSQSHKGQILSEEHKRKISDALKGRVFSEESRAKISRACKGRIISKEQREKISEKLTGRTFSEETKRKYRENLLRLWQNPEFRERRVKAIVKGAGICPTKPEIQLENILKKHFPQYQYNGDSRLGITIGGLIPDFPNVDGGKDLIEVFGDYYHSPKFIGDRWQGGELGRIMAYNSLGWRCLVIWEHELGELTEEQIVDKINKFQCRR